jgi:polar amino acid transport system substrate-binding protein
MKNLINLLMYIIIIPLSIFAVELTQEEQSFIKNNKVKIALMPDFSPFSFIEDDRVIGFENNLLKLISTKTGLKFQKNYGVWNKNLAAFKNKKVDMISSISYKKERELFTTFTTPYYNIPIMIFVRDDFGTYENLESLQSKKVGVLKDVFYINDLKKVKGLNLVIYETYEEVTNALVFGRIDALVQNLPNINYLIKKNLYTNLQLAAELKLPGIEKEDLRFGVNPDKPLLHSIIQKSLNSITKQEWDTLTDKWIDVKYNNYIKNKQLNSISLTQKEKDYISSKTINYCIDPHWDPFEYLEKDGTHNGLTKDYLDNIVKKIGIKTKLIKTKNWSQTIEYLKNRKCDMILEMAPTPSRKEYLSFTKPYLIFPQVIATKSDVSFIAGTSEILNKKVGFIKDYAIIEVLKLKYPNFQLIEVNNTIEGLEKVSNGELFAFVDFLPSVSRGINIIAKGNLKITGKLDESVSLGAASRNDEPILYSILQKSISTFKDQEHKAILDKWMTVRFEHGNDYTLVSIILLGAFTLFLVFGYWNYKMREAKKIIEKQNKELEHLANIDKLTGIYNRLRLDDILQNELDRFRRYNHHFACAIIDIDYFKNVNDTYGHLIGDKVLKELSNVVKQNIRTSDYFGRWGGEEFLIILPEINKVDLENLLEKIRVNISEHDFLEAGNQTISIGATISVKDDVEDSIINRADVSLYEAKNSGRNRIVVK